LLLTHRNLPQSKAIAIENDRRGTLRNFGLKIGIAGTVKFEGRNRELVENPPDFAVLIFPCPTFPTLLQCHESAYGTKRTSNCRARMFAFGGKADITFDRCNVRF
jgi:hypothetical protein